MWSPPSRRRSAEASSTEQARPSARPCRRPARRPGARPRRIELELDPLRRLPRLRRPLRAGAPRRLLREPARSARTRRRRRARPLPDTSRAFRLARRASPLRASLQRARRLPPLERRPLLARLDVQAVRSAEQLTRTPEQYREYMAAKRHRLLAELLRDLKAAENEDWYQWVLQYGADKRRDIAARYSRGK